MRCSDTFSDYFPINTGGRQGCVLAPTHFNTSMNDILERMSENSGCGVSFGTVEINDIEFADHAVIFAETTQVLMEPFELLSKEAELLGQGQGIECNH